MCLAVRNNEILVDERNNIFIPLNCYFCVTTKLSGNKIYFLLNLCKDNYPLNE